LTLFRSPNEGLLEDDMAWKAMCVLEQRKKFVREYETGDWTMSELCRFYEISRESGYKWIHRSQANDGLEDRSRAPARHPNQTERSIEEQLLGLRRQHPSWGPRKLLIRLSAKQPKVPWPAASTVGALLKREGLAIPRRKVRKIPLYTHPFEQVSAPNELWCADFKGWFRTLDHQRIDPLTITDTVSRYLLRCQVVEKTNTAQVQAIFEAAFREYGLPAAIRTDNGPPFASKAVAGLSLLSLFWMKLGIVPERIAPGHPEQNGRHERMHRTLKAETTRPPAAHRRAQQESFDRFQLIFNQQRPHQALAMKTPASCYARSPRPYPAKLPEPEYPSGLEVRRVRASGQFKWKGHNVFISEVLRQEAIGFELIENDHWLVYFASFPIALFDSYERAIHPLAAA
jgi:transposase InsO family protein